MSNSLRRSQTLASVGHPPTGLTCLQAAPEAERVLIVAEKISTLDRESIGWIRAKVPIDEIKKRRAEKVKEIKELKEKLLGRRLETHW